jgi:hypothetical protein
LRARPDSPQQGTERGRIGVAHLRRDLLDALRRGAQQMDGALGPQTLHERQRAHAERRLGPSLEGAPADPDRRRELPDIWRLAQAGAGLLLESEDQRVVVIEVIQGEVGALGGAFVDDQQPGDVLGQTGADPAHERQSQVDVGERGARGHHADVGDPAGAAVPFVTRRHVHRAVPQAAPDAPPATGVDYLGLVAAAHDEAAGAGAKIDFARLGMFTDAQEERR